MSEVLGRLNRTIEAQGPDSLLVEARDALASAYETISNLHVVRRARAEMVYAEVTELQGIIAEVEIHREMESTGNCCCGEEWPCLIGAAGPTWIDRAEDALRLVSGVVPVSEGGRNV
jgi:hypothetical protein